MCYVHRVWTGLAQFRNVLSRGQSLTFNSGVESVTLVLLVVGDQLKRDEAYHSLAHRLVCLSALTSGRLLEKGMCARNIL